jgi:tetratricopeptide (TPR) repeat protein
MEELEERKLIEEKLDPPYFAGKYDEMDVAAKELHPKTNLGRAALYYRVGYRNWQAKEHETALEYGNEMIRLGDERGHELRACYYAQKGMFAQLQAELAQYEPRDMLAVNLVLVAFQKPECVVAIQEIRDYAWKISGDSRNAGHCWNNLGWALSLKGESLADFHRAMDYFDQAEGIYIMVNIAENHLGGLNSRRGQTGAKIGAWIGYPYLARSVENFRNALAKSRDDAGFARALAFNGILKAEAEKKLGLSLAACAELVSG